jgi:hypothetical protein
MTVYLCYQCYYNGCEQFDRVAQVVDSVEKAEEWAIAVDDTEWEFRRFESVEVK